MLFFLTWPDRYSVLLDQPDEESARKAAREIAGGAEPATCVAFAANVFAAEVFLDEDDEGELLVLEPLQYVADALVALEEQAEEAAVVPAEAAACLFPPLQDDDGSILYCERGAHGDNRHEAHDARGGVVEWFDPEEAGG